MARVWVFAELAGGRPRGITLELLTLARDLGEVEAVALGPGAREAAGLTTRVLHATSRRP